MDNQLWVQRAPDVWQLAPEQHREEASGKALVLLDGKLTEVPLAKTAEFDPSHLKDLADLCDMNNLHEAPLFDTIRRRYLADNIYTNAGNILISVNPYKAIVGLYEEPLRYSLPLEKSDQIESLSPHLFKIANSAYGYMSHRMGNQSVVISGESGAGYGLDRAQNKTEASKHVMTYLIAVNDQQLSGSGKVSSGVGHHIKKVLLDSNIVFESFGNAKTVRNDNSSRFGKYIRLQYTSNNVLVSAYTDTFLLERSRLTSPSSDGERRFHIFYGMLRGSNSTLNLRQLGLDVALDSFPILCQPSGKNPFLPEDVSNFSDLCSSLSSLGVSDVELKEIWSLLACILHLSNVHAADSGIEEGEGLHGASLTCGTQAMASIAERLGLSESSFIRALTIHTIHVVNEEKNKVLSAEDVINNIHALMKWLYSALFKWLILKINYSHCMSSPHGAGDKSHVAVRFIGILDIFGFEILKHNSFEQLCINYTNERLQQQFNEQIFVNEQLEYESEGLNWTNITFRNNQSVIDLISKKPTGLLNILEEHGFMNRRPDDRALLHEYDRYHNNGQSAYSKSRYGDESFLVRHFAGTVEYEVLGFIEKNNDTLQEDLLRLLHHSTNIFLLNMSGIVVGEAVKGRHFEMAPGYVPSIENRMIIRVDGGDADLEEVPVFHSKASSLRHRSSIVAVNHTGDGGGLGTRMAASVTVSFQFRHQLDDLMKTLRATRPHYIKCIKPNDEKRSLFVVSTIVMEQLRYSGVLEVVRIRREGYPISFSCMQFYEMFAALMPLKTIPSPRDCSSVEAKQWSELLLQKMLPAGCGMFQLGFWKVFLKEKALSHLYSEAARVHDKHAIVVQSKFRAYIRWRKYKAGRKAVIALQAKLRMRAAVSRWRTQLVAMRIVQKFLHRRYEIKQAALRLEELRKRKAVAERERIEAELERQALALAERRASEDRLAREREAELKRQAATRAEEMVVRLSAMHARLGQLIVPLQSMIRVFLAKRYAIRLRVAIAFIRQFVLRVLPVWRLFARIQRLHRWCRTGDVDSLANHLTDHFDDRAVRNKWQNYQTCLHSAVQGGQLDIMDILRPNFEDVLLRDINGYTALHHAAMFPNLQVVKYLEKVLLLKHSPLGSVSFSDDWGLVDVDDEFDGRSVSETQSVVDFLEKADFGELHKEGWLKKTTRGFLGTGSRWVMVYESHLLYYRKPGDARPRGVISLAGARVKRSKDDKLYAFDIVSDQMNCRRKKKSNAMRFIASSEKELQEWLLPLKSLAGVEHAFRETPPVHYINSNLRDAWLADQNYFGETALHVAARYKPTTTMVEDSTVIRKTAVRKQSFVMEPPRPLVALADSGEVLVTQFCLWLIDGGCPIDTQSRKGQTALHIAAWHQNSSLVYCLIRKGCQRLLLDKSGALAENYAKHKTVLAMQRAVAELSHEESPMRLLPRPDQLRGFSYLHLLLEKHDSEGSLPIKERVCLLISVTNAKSELVEAVQCTPVPMIAHDDPHYYGRTYLWWGYSWHMQTPLENIEPGCTIQIQLHRLDATGKLSLVVTEPSKASSRRGSGGKAEPTSLLAKAVFHLDLEVINSGLVTIPFYAPAGRSEHSCLQADMVVSKRTKAVSLEEYKKMQEAPLSRPAIFTSVFSSRTILDMASFNKASSSLDFHEDAATPSLT